jgi:hypothetical protein
MITASAKGRECKKMSSHANACSSFFFFLLGLPGFEDLEDAGLDAVLADAAPAAPAVRRSSIEKFM